MANQSLTFIELFEREKQRGFVNEFIVFAILYLNCILLAWVFYYLGLSQSCLIQTYCVLFTCMCIVSIVVLSHVVVEQIIEKVETLKITNIELEEDCDELLASNKKLLNTIIQYEEIIRSRSNSSSRSNSPFGLSLIAVVAPPCRNTSNEIVIEYPEYEYPVIKTYEELVEIYNNVD